MLLSTSNYSFEFSSVLSCRDCTASRIIKVGKCISTVKQQIYYVLVDRDVSCLRCVMQQNLLLLSGEKNREGTAEELAV